MEVSIMQKTKIFPNLGEGWIPWSIKYSCEKFLVKKKVGKFGEFSKSQWLKKNMRAGTGSLYIAETFCSSLITGSCWTESHWVF